MMDRIFNIYFLELGGLLVKRILDNLVPLEKIQPVPMTILKSKGLRMGLTK